MSDKTGAVPASRRIDLHCHSRASTEADEALLIAIRCPESYSEPEEVYAQAKRRGMDFVTITDHDSIEGVKTLADRADVLIGEELTCYFPEDQCKMHVLIWGITKAQHDALQAVANDIYEVAAYIEANRIAHSVAHPVYRQNDRLERWHLDRLMLLFKGFECLNGAHSNLHREAFEPLLNDLSPQRLAELSREHNIVPRWPVPWVKARTGGSDDHGLFNIGRTWTEFPPDATTVEAVLECLREGRCRPGGEAGSSLKLAHNFFSVGIQYYGKSMAADAKPDMTSIMLRTLIGQGKRLRKRDVVKTVVKDRLSRFASRLARPFRCRRPEPVGTALLMKLFADSIESRIGEHPWMKDALSAGAAPLGEHASMFGLVCELNRDISQGVAASVGRALGKGELMPLFDAISAVAAHQFIQMPYYFALFHQNRERHLLRRITGHGRRIEAESLRVGVFTDTFDENSETGRLVRGLANRAAGRGRSVAVHTCGDESTVRAPWRKNFAPLVSQPVSAVPGLKLTLPPVAEVLEWADRQQFDAIHVDTPGPMGLCGLLVARMLRVPMLVTAHTDFAAMVAGATGDHRLTVATQGFLKWFYAQAQTVFTHSRAHAAKLAALGVPAEKIVLLAPAVDTELFAPRPRETGPGMDRNRNAFRILYRGPVSKEKNVPLLAEAFRLLCKTRNDATLIVAGEGPYRETMRRELSGLPVHFMNDLDGPRLSSWYAAGDVFAFPSAVETLGQSVLEAQACGVPVLVSDAGGPQELMDDGITGRVLPANDAAAWASAVACLMDDEASRLRMARTAPHRVARFAGSRTFDAFWDEHLKASLAALAREGATASPVPADLTELAAP